MTDCSRTWRCSLRGRGTGEERMNDGRLGRTRGSCDFGRGARRSQTREITDNDIAGRFRASWQQARNVAGKNSRRLRGWECDGGDRHGHAQGVLVAQHATVLRVKEIFMRNFCVRIPSDLQQRTRSLSTQMRG